MCPHFSINSANSKKYATLSKIQCMKSIIAGAWIVVFDTKSSATQIAWQEKRPQSEQPKCLEGKIESEIKEEVVTCDIVSAF